MSKSNGWLGGENGNLGGSQREVRWLTPPSLVAKLGNFDLDPCGAPNHSLADTTFLLEKGQDGLQEDWVGRVWLNPPYGPMQRPFMEKMAEHNHGTALVFARTETKLWHDWIFPYASGLLFLRGRITFLDYLGRPAKANSGAPSILVSYGESDRKILEANEGLGKFVNL